MKLAIYQSWYLIPVILSLLQFALGDDDTISCDKDNKCPKSSPCCSQYGQCGTGAYCLGGCDIRFSYSLDSCMPMPRMTDFNISFTSTKQLEKQDEYLGNSSETDWLYTGYIDTHDDALLLQMPNHTSGTVISSSKYLWYGKVSAKLKTSRDGGVITAFILFSDVQDEIDFEYVGYNLTAPQSNYYHQGILDYNNAKNSSTSDTFKNYHTYTIDWQEDKIDWYVDDEKVRTLEKKDTKNETTGDYDYPQTPSRIQMSLWPGGASSNGLGTIEWAGGEINWDSEDIKKTGYYYAYLKEVEVTTYDLPDDVELDGSDDPDDLHAFLFNSTDGNMDNIYLTNKTTWLGNGDATGLDPDNDKKKSSKSTSKSESKSNSKSKSGSTGTSTSKTVAVPTDPKATIGDSDGNDGAATYNPSGGIGGFVQNSKKTDDSSDSSGSSGSSGSSSSSNNSPTFNIATAFGIASATVFGVISLFF